MQFLHERKMNDDIQFYQFKEILAEKRFRCSNESAGIRACMCVYVPHDMQVRVGFVSTLAGMECLDPSVHRLPELPGQQLTKESIFATQSKVLHIDFFPLAYLA